MPTTGRYRRFCQKACADAQYKLDHREQCNANSRAWVAANPDQRRAHQAAYRDKNAAEIAEARREAQASGQYLGTFRRWRNSEHGKYVIWANTLWKRYKITAEQYEALLEAQGGVCAMCAKPPADARRFAVDHDHRCCPGRETCGKCIRGLLCTSCNNHLGILENETFVAAADAYRAAPPAAAILGVAA